MSNLNYESSLIESAEAMRGMAQLGSIDVGQLWNVHGVMQELSSRQGTSGDGAMARSLTEQAAAMALIVPDEEVSGRCLALRGMFKMNATGSELYATSRELARAGYNDQRVWDLSVKAAALGIIGISPARRALVTSGPRILWAEARNKTPDPSSAVFEEIVVDGTRIRNIVSHHATVHRSEIATPDAARLKLIDLVAKRPSTLV